MYNHILLEVYCLKGTDENEAKKRPDFCTSTDCQPQYNCITNKCPFMAFTSCENALCYLNQSSETDVIISLGEDSYTTEQLLLWKQISHKKIDEAYDEFLRRLNETE